MQALTGEFGVQRFSQAQLRRCNGRDGAPAYFAYEGRVYDATRSFHWQAGRHQVIHSAGADLTGQLAGAPHGLEMLRRLPCLGILVESTGEEPGDLP